MKKRKFVPVLLASTLVLTACGKDDSKNNAEETKYEIITEESMVAEDVMKVKVEADIVANVVATILIAHEDSHLRNFSLKSELISEDEIARASLVEDEIDKIVANLIYNVDNQKGIAKNLKKEYEKNFWKYNTSDWDRISSALDEKSLKISQNKDDYIATINLEAAYQEINTRKTEYLNYEIRMIMSKGEKGEIKTTYIEFEEGTSDLGKGKLTKSGIQTASKEAIEFGIKNALGLFYEDNGEASNAFKTITNNAEVAKEFVENFEINRDIENIRFEYTNAEASSKEDGKDYTQEFSYEADVKIITTIGGKQEEDNKHITLTMRNTSSDTYVNYAFYLTDLKID